MSGSIAQGGTRRGRWVLVLLALLISFWTAIGYALWHGLLGMRTFYLPASSMMPTLHGGDFFIADLKAYENKAPERGDIIVFRTGSNQEIIYSKRIIGLPGDRVQMRDGKVILNGKLIPQRDTEPLKYKESSGDRRRLIDQQIEELPSGREYTVLDETANGLFDNTDTFVVPENHYFVLGDHRDNSSDSRMRSGGIGMVPRENILGQIWFIYWSRDFSRIGHRVQ